MKDTKKNILESAICLFNAEGLVNVRLQNIADHASMSIGNMVYHYKNKEAIVQAVHAEMASELQSLMSEMNIVPLFEYIDQYFQRLFNLQRKYSFFFTDMLEVFRGYPDIACTHRELIEWQKSQYETILQFNCDRGVLTLSNLAGQIEYLTDQLWMTTYMYTSFQLVNGKELTVASYCRQIWSIFVPLMTHQGLLEYKQMRSYDRGLKLNMQ